MHDIIPPENRSIRNVPLNKKSSRAHKHHKPLHEELPANIEAEPRYEFEDSLESMEASGHSLFFYTCAIVIPILVIAVGLGFYSIEWSGAEVIVTPKTQKLDVSFTTSAARDSTASTSLHYTILTKTVEGSIDVPALGEEMVTTSASGQIIIYNTESTAVQKLITNTRFATADGKIYRIHSPVIVPGYTKKAGKIIAGSIEVTVYADLPGPAYNIDLADFTIPGFKGDPRYKTIYARSKTAMTGGFVGTRKKVSDADIKQKSSALIDTLQNSATTQFASSTDLVLVPGGIFFETREEGRTDTGSSTVSIKEAVDAHAFAFSRTELSQVIAAQSNLGTEKDSVTIRDFSGLTLTTDQSIAPWKTNKLSITLKGSATVFWFYNVDKLKQDLAGLPKEDAKNVLAKYLGIQTAESIVRPFWKTAFPQDPAKIRIIELTK